MERPIFTNGKAKKGKWEPLNTLVIRYLKTPHCAKSANGECKNGQSIVQNWRIDAVKTPSYASIVNGC